MEEINETETEISKAEELLNDFGLKDGKGVYKLIKPVTVNGTNYTELELDFNGLTATDMEAVETTVMIENATKVQLREFSKTYQYHVVARAAKINVHDIRGFSAKDATVLSLMAQSFLLSGVV